jgi:hypothetical protein
MYPYYIQTTYGNSYPYDTETNVSVWQPTGTMLLVHSPLPETRAAKRFYVVQPVLQGGLLSLADGSTIPLEQLQHLYGTQLDTASNGAPVFMGYPIDMTDVKNPELMTTMQLPGLVIPIFVIVLVAVAVIIFAAAIIANTVAEYLKQMHALDLAAQSQDMIERLYINTDTGEQQSQWFDGATIERRTLKNGEIIDIPLNTKGQDYNIATCGKALCVILEGIDLEALADQITQPVDWEQIMMYIARTAAAVAGIYVAAKIIPMLFQKKQPQPQYPPPQQYYPPPQQYRRAPDIEYVQ